jgi:H+/Cl- antiporter ClcA
MTRVRRGTAIVAAVVFAVTAVRSFARMGPTPDGTCAMSPTCPNTQQWVALLVVAVVCGLLALMTPGLLWSDPARRRWWTGPALALALAAALVIVDPPGHLNSLHATWFGRPLGDGTLN